MLRSTKAARPNTPAGLNLLRRFSVHIVVGRRTPSPLQGHKVTNYFTAVPIASQTKHKFMTADEKVAAPPKESHSFQREGFSTLKPDIATRSLGHKLVRSRSERRLLLEAALHTGSRPCTIPKPVIQLDNRCFKVLLQQRCILLLLIIAATLR